MNHDLMVVVQSKARNLLLSGNTWDQNNTSVVFVIKLEMRTQSYSRHVYYYRFCTYEFNNVITLDYFARRLLKVEILRGKIM